MFFLYSCNDKNAGNEPQNGNTPVVYIPYNEGEAWGFTDANGKVVIKALYDEILPFSEGFAAVRINQKWGFIDRSGNFVVKPNKYDSVGSFSEGKAYVRLGNRCGFIDGQGTEVIKPNQLFGAGKYSDGLAVACIDQLYGYLDHAGEVAIDFKYDFAWDFDDGMARVHKNNKYGLIDKTGKEVIPVQYDHISPFNDGVALLKKNNTWGLVDTNGELKNNLSYQFIEDTDHMGYYKVLKNGKYGFIDKNANVLIIPKYDYIGEFRHGLARVEIGNHTALIDRSGREVNDFENVFTKHFYESELIKNLEESSVEFIGDDKLSQETEGVYVDERDGMEYTWQRIGRQVWMNENLKYQTFGSKCYESKGKEDCTTYGVYYSWKLAQKSCPSGWKLPTERDWKILINAQGGAELAYEKLKVGGETNMNLSLGGYIYKNSSFEEVENYGYYWSSTNSPENRVACFWMNKFEQMILKFDSDKTQLRNVRCIKSNQ